MLKKIVFFICLLTQVIILSSCASTPEITEIDGVKVADSQINNDKEKNDDFQNDKDKTDTLSNIDVIANSVGQQVDKKYKGENNSIIIDAKVEIDTNNISSINRYNYIREPIQDSLSKDILKTYFKDKYDQIQYDDKNNRWILKNTDNIGDYYSYSTYTPLAGEQVGEEAFLLEYRMPDFYPFKDNILNDISNSKVDITIDNAIKMCDEFLEGIKLDDYQVDYIKGFGTDGRYPYYKIAYKMYKDGLPITAYNDICFLVDSDGIQQILGSIYSVKILSENDNIISLEAALNILEDEKETIYITDKKDICISKVTFEYIVCKNIDEELVVTPVWRFLIGENEMISDSNRDLILAVNAITGEVIQSERGNAQ